MHRDVVVEQNDGSGAAQVCTETKGQDTQSELVPVALLLRGFLRGVAVPTVLKASTGGAAAALAAAAAVLGAAAGAGFSGWRPWLRREERVCADMVESKRRGGTVLIFDSTLLK